MHSRYTVPAQILLLPVPVYGCIYRMHSLYAGLRSVGLEGLEALVASARCTLSPVAKKAHNPATLVASARCTLNTLFRSLLVKLCARVWLHRRDALSPDCAPKTSLPVVTRLALHRQDALSIHCTVRFLFHFFHCLFHFLFHCLCSLSYIQTSKMHGSSSSNRPRQ